MAGVTPSISWSSLGLRLRHVLREHRLGLSTTVLGVSIVLILLALGAFTSLSTEYPFIVINQYTDQTGSRGENWNLLFAILAPIPFIVGVYLVGAYLVARRRFELLISSESAVELRRNVPEFEHLLRELTPSDEVRYERKCSELHVRQ